MRSNETTMRTFVAHVIEPRDPALRGRVLVRYEPDGETPQDAWIPVLRGLSVRFGDAVLVAGTSNGCDPVLVGIIDGFGMGSDPNRRPTSELELREDEVLEIRDSHGRVLLVLHEGDRGRTLRLVRPDLDVEVVGCLRIRSDELAIAALRSATMPAADDLVMVRGEVIRVD